MHSWLTYLPAGGFRSLKAAVFSGAARSVGALASGLGLVAASDALGAREKCPERQGHRRNSVPYVAEHQEPLNVIFKSAFRGPTSPTFFSSSRHSFDNFFLYQVPPHHNCPWSPHYVATRSIAIMTRAQQTISIALLASSVRFSPPNGSIRHNW